MKDMNFFAAYKTSGKKLRDGGKSSSSFKRIAILVVVFVILALAGIGGYTFWLQLEINRMDAYLKAPEVVAKLKEYREVKLLNDSYKQYAAILDDLSRQIGLEPRVDSDLINRIYGAVPGGVQITNLAISKDAITLSGTFTSRDNIPALIRNLKNAGRIRDVFVENESSGNTGNTFAARCVLEGGRAQ
ncbi:MAG TPA: hypothetical protein DD727_07615 [Clostridiales bacterium]|nr:hypothetical protein [Clostridiales bacterium]